MKEWVKKKGKVVNVTDEIMIKEKIFFIKQKTAYEL